MNSDWKNVGIELSSSTGEEDFVNEVISSARSIEETAGEASEETCGKILAGIQKDGKGNIRNTVVAVSCILQRGGTSKNAPASMKMTIGTTTVSLELIRRHCRIANDTKVRQFARGIKDQIIQVMQFLGQDAPDGNLAKTMRLDISNVSKDEAIWASDFQTYNDDCPEVVKNWLVKNYRNRFRRG